MVCTDLKDQMSVIQNMGQNAANEGEIQSGQESEELGSGNKWSNRRYEPPSLNESVEEAGIGSTEVGLNYDLAESALQTGVAVKLLCNSTYPIQTNGHPPEKDSHEDNPVEPG